MRLSPILTFALATALGGLGIAVGCSDDTVDGANTSGAGASSGTNTGAGGGTGGTGGSGGSSGTNTTGVGGAPTVESECQGHVYECGDIEDNDGDGLIDYQDPDCLGPCDNTEGSFYGGIPGQTGPACIVDCYFDQDSGAGNDDCYWNHKCDDHEVPPNYYPESANGAQCAHDTNANTPGTAASCDELYATQSQECYDYCGPLTPNGCDCFGCCELPAGSGSYVWLGSEDDAGNGTCDIANMNNPDMCQPCLPVAACLNDCGPCEICIGKPEPDPGCDGAGGSSGAGGAGQQQCEEGVQPCGLPGQDPCPAGDYCITGCCRPEPT
jgi:hypothetical protein